MSGTGWISVGTMDFILLVPILNFGVRPNIIV